MIFYAHTLEGQLPANWEPLFTPFGEGVEQCQRDKCQKCERMDSQHGHLNKVAYHTAKFAAAMFPPDSEESKSAHQWGFLTGLWHESEEIKLTSREDRQLYLFQRVNINFNPHTLKECWSGVRRIVCIQPYGIEPHHSHISGRACSCGLPTPNN